MLIGIGTRLVDRHVRLAVVSGDRYKCVPLYTRIYVHVN